MSSLNVTSETYTIKPTKKTIKQLLKLGNYDWINPDIEKNFAAETCTESLELFSFEGNVTTQQVEGYFKEHGYEAANMTELLHLGIQHPGVQREKLVVALRAAFLHSDGYRYVGCLNGDSDSRHCYLYWDDPGRQWYSYCVFAGLRKSSDSGKLSIPEPLGSLPLELEINGFKYQRKHE